jgi:hypothetical protein
MRTTAGQILINDALPHDLRDYSRVLDKAGIQDLMKRVATQYPDRYRTIVKDLSDVGRHIAYVTNGNSVGLDDLRPSPRAEDLKKELRAHVNQIMQDPGLSPADKRTAVVEAARSRQQPIVDAVFQDSQAENNPLARQLVGAGRGDKHALSRLKGSDVLYADGQGRPIATPVYHSYSQGLSPAEYFAASFGARSGILATKKSTADAGFAAKQLLQASHRLVVSAHDSDEEPATIRGLPVDVNDADNEGALLATDVGQYKRNTVLTPAILRQLKNDGIQKFLVRSPTVGGPADGGVYSRDVGVREKQYLAPVGDFVGAAASQAISEPVTQMQLKSKHQGGVVGNQKLQGFAVLNNMLQVPEVFPGGATHAQQDGRVQSVVSAPQGGKFVIVNGERHYVPEDQAVTVKPQDEVEAGDVLSDGLPNPQQITQHKGIGAGRQYFVSAFRDLLKNSGSFGHRRNIELVARGLINHVRLTDEVGDWAPDDIVPYSTLEHQWEPRPGSTIQTPHESANHYLEQPVLHYSIGTRVTPSVMKNLKDFNVNSINVHRDPPPFQPEMVRAMENVSHDPDWMVKFIGGYQERGLLRSVARGSVSDTNSTSFVPALAEGKTFGKQGPTKGWDPTASTKLPLSL